MTAGRNASAARRRNGLRALGALALTAALTACSNSDSGGAGGSSSSGTFRALSYNVAGLPEIVSDEDPRTNAPLISPLLNDYDLVLLQEDWGDPIQRLETMGLLPAGSYPGVLGYHHLIVADVNHPYRSEPAPPPLGLELRRGVDGLLGPTLLADGLNRLSRSPFGDVTRVMWRECHGSTLMVPLDALLGVLVDIPGIGDLLAPFNLTGDDGLIDDGATDCAAQKGFSVATHELAPGVLVDVYNHHADASSHNRDLAAKQDNFAQLADFILEHSAGRAVIVGGDTNLRFDRSRREEQQVIDGGTWAQFQEATGLRDVCATIDCGDLDTMAADEGFSAHDRFAFRSGGGVELRALSHRFERDRFMRDDGEPLSDHDPVAVVFEWRAVPSP